MSGKSNIEWTEATWNPIVGCSILSPGCTNCYAMKMAARIQKMNRTGGSGSDYVNHYDGTTRSVNGHSVWTGKLALAPDNIFNAPLSRKKPTTWFVNSMGDLFHEDVPDEWIDRVFAVMALTPQHTYQVLTKRAARMRGYMRQYRGGRWMDQMRAISPPPNGRGLLLSTESGVLRNTWLGVSTERQQEADERVPLLLDTPAAKRFVSAEPLLGHLALNALNLATETPSDALRGVRRVPHDCKELTEPTAKLDWVIAGGESGPKARPMHPDWVRSLHDQCAAAGTAFFFKQWGEHVPIPLRDNHRIDRSRFYLNGKGLPFHQVEDYALVRVGKKAAGRLLDGVEHNAMPEVAR